MSKLLIIFTIAVAALCASGFKLESILPRTDTEPGNMYIPYPNYECDYIEIYVDGSTGCGYDKCILPRGIDIKIRASCIPAKDIYGICINYGVSYYGFPPMVGTYCVDTKCTAGQPFSYNQTVNLPVGTPPGPYSLRWEMSEYGYPPYLMGIPGCACTVV